MSDGVLRQLERRFKETGSESDEVAWLYERLRVGELNQDQLSLAAYCGYPAAAAMVGAANPPSAIDEWIAGLAPWGKQVAVTAGVIAAERVLGICEEEFPQHPTPRNALMAARAWIRDPSSSNLSGATAAASEAAMGGTWHDTNGMKAGFAVSSAARAVGDVEPTGAADLAALSGLFVAELLPHEESLLGWLQGALLREAAPDIVPSDG